MAAIRAYLDDFGKAQVIVNRNFYNGQDSGFYLTSDDGFYGDCIVRGVEEHSWEFRYDLTIPADLKFGKLYTMHDCHGQAVPLEIRFIVRTRTFNEMFTYDGDDLGSIYSRDHTDFAVWCPTACRVFIRLRDGRGETTAWNMVRREKGVWRCRINGDLSRCTYIYIIERDGELIESIDPYGLSSNANSQESAVIDTSKIYSIPDPGVHSVMKSYADAIVYETSVRDMTSLPTTGTSTHGKFISLTETGTSYHDMPTGLDYLASLGVTHIQFQPVTDFATIDELHPEKGYNWGYDPAQLLSLEGSYALKPEDPYSRMIEFRRMVSALHSRGLRVNLDLVFNHMYDVNATSLHKTVPYYYFRYNNNGWLSNGSWCGNDLDSRQPMMQKLFLHVIRTLMRLYGVDGFRFDLMGILDVDTMNQILAAAKSIKPEAMVYGEGWDMPTFLNESEKAKIYNQHRMPGIGHFNDTFRDIAKGKTSDDQKYDKGYLTGNLGMAFDMCSALTGNSASAPFFRRFDSPVQSINAMETHDNATIWDKMHACCADEPKEIRIKRQKMMIAATMIAQGVPFLHAGMEFAGTKQDNSNSYNAGDTINGMNWERMIYNKDLLNYTKRCISFRKNWQAYHLTTAEQISEKVHFSIQDGYIIFYDVDFIDKDHDSLGLRTVINPGGDWKNYHFDGTWNIVLNENGDSENKDISEVGVPPYTIIVLSKRK